MSNVNIYSLDSSQHTIIVVNNEDQEKVQQFLIDNDISFTVVNKDDYEGYSEVSNLATEIGIDYESSWENSGC